ncbi:hypothetical protein KY362_03720, partial [Candidatus Woesearchaeota archaeon]|nr:hypothetical protein [Candidatus Woesearchaeota archaeon]
MKELISELDEEVNVDYLLDTCFVMHCVEHDHMKKLTDFCESHDVGMSSFNLEELDHVHHNLKGNQSHHLREFLKSKCISRVSVRVSPGDREGEVSYVQSFDPEI